MRIASTKPIFPWDCLDDGPDLKTIETFLGILPDGLPGPTGGFIRLKCCQMPNAKCQMPNKIRATPREICSGKARSDGL